MFGVKNLKCTSEPDGDDISGGKIEMITKPHTDLWQRTYYYF